MRVRRRLAQVIVVAPARWTVAQLSAATDAVLAVGARFVSVDMSAVDNRVQVQVDEVSPGVVAHYAGMFPPGLVTVEVGSPIDAGVGPP